MKMYAVVDREHPEIDSYTSYHQTLEEADERIENSTRHDREGDHPGKEYLSIEIREVDYVPCAVCEEHVTAKNPERYPYCRSCHYTGAADEHLRANQLHYFRLEIPEANVFMEHTGGGCKWLAFYFPNREGREYLTATDGGASLPSIQDDEGEWVPIRGGWGYLCIQYDCVETCGRDGGAIAEPCCGDGGPVLFSADWPEGTNEYPGKSLRSDEELVAMIRGWLDGTVVPTPARV